MHYRSKLTGYQNIAMRIYPKGVTPECFNRYGFNSPQLAAQWRSQVFLRSVIPACF